MIAALYEFSATGVVVGEITYAREQVLQRNALVPIDVPEDQIHHVVGSPLGAMQHWQFQMAQRAMELECARNLYQKSAMLLDTGDAKIREIFEGANELSSNGSWHAA